MRKKICDVPTWRLKLGLALELELHSNRTNDILSCRHTLLSRMAHVEVSRQGSAFAICYKTG